MLHLVTYTLAGWFLAVQAVGLLARLPGLHVLPQAAPRVLGLGFAGAAAVCWWYGGARWLVPLLAPVGILAAAALACGIPRRPDRGYLPPTARGAEEVAIEGHPDAAALFLRPEPADGPLRTVVVLAHGGGNDRLFGLWLVIDELRAAGHGVLTGHLAGHGVGGSDLFDLEAGRARLDALVVEAQSRAGGAPVVVLGQSVGASLALDMVARGNAPDSLVTVSAAADGLDVGAGSASELLGLCRPAIYRALAYGNTYEVLPAVGRFKRRAFPVRVDGARSYHRALDQAIRQMELPAHLAGAPQCPILLIHGTLDGVIRARHARVLDSSLGGQATLALLRGATHMDPLFDPRAIRRILGWLDALG